MINIENLLEVAKITIPEFKKEYDKNIEEGMIDEETGIHVVFGYAFTPVLINAINNDKDLAKRMFDFVEKMSASGVVEVQEVCDFSVLEAVCDEFPDNVLIPLMGESTLEGLRAVRRYIGVND